MTCPTFDVLSAYADGEATAQETAALAPHLAACPACARTLRSLAAAKRALAALPVPAAPPDLAGALLKTAPRPGPLRLLLDELHAGLSGPSGAVAAAALAAAALLLWGRRPAPDALAVPAEVLVSAHRRYAQTMPLAPEAAPPAPPLLAGGVEERDVY